LLGPWAGIKAEAMAAAFFTDPTNVDLSCFEKKKIAREIQAGGFRRGRI